MLHIILLILKIIGFLILGILALVLLLTAVILLTPFVYGLEFSVDNSLESAKGRIRFHWLMHLISGEVRYEDGSFDWHIRAAWKKLGDEADGSYRNNADGHIVADNTQISKENDRADNRAADRMGDHKPVRTEKTADETADNAADEEEKPTHELESSPKSSPDPHIRSITDKNVSPKRRTDNKKISCFYERFKKVPEKIKYTFRKICDKIRTLRKKKDRIAAFLRNSTHQNAFSRLIKELKRLLHFLKPSGGSVDLEFGFSDPSYTGYTLAGISMIYPMIGEYTQIKPDFEHKVLKGNVFIKGKVRILYGLIFAWNMFWDKNVRVTYRHIRKFKL